MNGGDLVAKALQAHGVEHVYTLCGGHISPILVGCKQLGIEIVDVRHEVDAVFAADAEARITGRPGVAAVTAGPGATNTITAIKNAQLAQSPVVLIGGAAATILRGRGSLQDIDQLALFEPHVKWAASAEKVRELPGMVETAMRVAAAGVPGPVFIECPVDLLYGEEIVRKWYGESGGGGLKGWVVGRYLGRHVDRLFKGAQEAVINPSPQLPEVEAGDARKVRKAASRLASAKRPLLVVGSQALIRGGLDGGAAADRLATAIRQLAVPVYLAGSARGLLGRDDPLQLRHRRRKAIKQADVVILAGFPADFRLDYGRQIRRGATLVGANLDGEELNLNRRPDIAVEGDPASFLLALAGRRRHKAERWQGWLEELKASDREREDEIAAMARQETSGVNPVDLCRQIEAVAADDSVLVVDGGDFVATAAYTVRPRGPLRWLDPGAFGTLGVGGGFALGARMCRPGAEIWLIYGDGSAAYSLAEIDTFVRHGVSVIAVIGNDAGWTQIAREQVPILGDDVATVLAKTDYHRVAEGYGGRGLLLDRPEAIPEVLRQAQEIAAGGEPVVINAHIGPTDFRKGSISI
ncbi:MAG: thiamine pyrophosphate-binding protein [Acidobacteriota bacterium]